MTTIYDNRKSTTRVVDGVRVISGDHPDLYPIADLTREFGMDNMWLYQQNPASLTEPSVLELRSGSESVVRKVIDEDTLLSLQTEDLGRLAALAGVQDWIGKQGSPFDAIKRTRDDGTEYWSARDLAQLMGYTQANYWQKFKTPLERAMKSAEVQNAAVTSHFTRSGETVKGGGPLREDYELSRFAAYLVAMNGDPNKPEVAAAQAYFAVRTREAETAEAEPTQENASTSHVTDAGKLVEEIRELRKEIAELKVPWYRRLLPLA